MPGVNRNAAINVMPDWGGGGTLNVLGHPRWGILANFEHKCWPRDREVWTMLKRRKRTGFWMWEAWIRMFRQLESTRIPRSSSFPVTIKWRNKRDLTNRCFCWRALARQLPILYNREEKAKSVGCKIWDLRSKFAFNIRGLWNVETCAVDYGCLWMHVELSIHFKGKEGQDKGGEFLHLCR